MPSSTVALMSAPHRPGAAPPSRKTTAVGTRRGSGVRCRIHPLAEPLRFGESDRRPVGLCPPEWADVFGDPVVATALLDRLLHHAIVIQIEGASYRLRAHADLIASNTPSSLFTTAQKKRRGRPPNRKKEVSIYNPG